MRPIVRKGSFVHSGNRLAYTEYGRGERVLVLTHGLLLSQRMHEPLARALAARGNRVITLDLLGHGASDRPRDMWRYSMTLFAEQVVAVLDHLDIDSAVIGGTSLGANVTLEVAFLAPSRVRGMVVEMPVLDNALVAGALAFTPIMVAFTFAEPVMLGLAGLVRRLPHRGVPFWLDVGLDILRQDPGPSAAVVQGVLFGRVAPHRRERRRLTQPALIIGHHRDPIHPFSDAGMLAEELRNARLAEASTVLELRLTPQRLTGEIATFLDECWAPRRVSPRRPAARRSAHASGSSAAG
ncbi:MAG: alpha/beta hydrolase [Chloroflexi bacterium]|nr:MAG: alpha/beta hydrolase [Chloroflexota bacterium]